MRNAGRLSKALNQRTSKETTKRLYALSNSTHARKTQTHRPVTELMSASKKTKPMPAPTAEDPPLTSTLWRDKNKRQGWDPRDGLGVYIQSPETNPEGRIVSYDDDFVVIRDKFPKASVHLLLIPRAPERYFQHPLELLSKDDEFLAEVKRRVEGLKDIAAQELRRQYGHLSALDAPYQTALDLLHSAPDPPTQSQLNLLPPGRDWSRDVIIGVHTHPSMNHLHIHILSRDMHSEWMKHKKHYLSFTTGFLVKMENFPLEEGSERFRPGNWPDWDMKCWRCGENFGNRWKKLSEHLEGEYEEWRKE